MPENISVEEGGENSVLSFRSVSKKRLHQEPSNIHRPGVDKSSKCCRQKMKEKIFCIATTTKGRVPKETIESMSMLIPPSDPPSPPSTVSALGYFFCAVFGLFVMLGTL